MYSNMVPVMQWKIQRSSGIINFQYSFENNDDEKYPLISFCLVKFSLYLKIN